MLLLNVSYYFILGQVVDVWCDTIRLETVTIAVELIRSQAM
jgi:hypothetical protein